MRKFPLSAAAIVASMTIAAALAFVAPLKAAPVDAVPVMKVAGTLTCQVAPGLGLGLASSRPGTCIFDHLGDQGFSESYESRFERVGFDLGVMGSQSFKLTVMTPNGDATPGFLTGTHQGRSSESSFGKADGIKVAFQSEKAHIVFEQSGESSWVGLNLGSGETRLQLDNPHAI